MRFELLLIVAGRLWIALLLVAGLRIMTHYLPPQEYGMLAILTVFQSFAGLVFISPVGQYLNRHTHEWMDQGLLLPYMRSLARYWLVVAVSVGGMALVWLGLDIYRDHWGFALMAALVVGVMIYANTAFVTHTGRLNMLGDRKSAVFWQVSAMTLGLIMSWLLVDWGAGVIGWFAGQALGYCLGAWGGHLQFARKMAGDAVHGVYSIRQILPADVFRVYCVPLALIALFSWLDGNAYRFALENAWGLERLGIFAMALAIPAQMTVVFESIVQQAVYPFAFRGLADGEGDATVQAGVVTNLVMFLMPLYLIWGAFLVLASEALMVLLTDPLYHQAASLLIVGVILELLRLLYAPWLFAAQAMKDFRDIRMPFLVSAVLVVSSAVMVVVGHYGEWFFGVCLLAAAVIKFLMIMMRMTRKLNLHLSWVSSLLATILLLVVFWLKFGSGALEVETWQQALYFIVVSSVMLLALVAVFIGQSNAFKYLKQFRISPQ